jgi:hypothetical protein
MCDYSLEMYHSRPARAGERYVLHRFRSGSLGFVDPADCETAVCLPAGARLRLGETAVVESISPRVQQAYALGRTAEVVMTRVSYSGRLHRDGVRAANNREFLLQSLNPGVSAVLLPRDLEAVFDLKDPQATTVDRTENAAAPIAVHAVARFAHYLTRLRSRATGSRGRQALSTIDA